MDFYIRHTCLLVTVSVLIIVTTYIKHLSKPKDLLPYELMRILPY